MDSNGEHPALYVYRDSSVRHGLSFEKITGGLPKRAESRLLNLDEIIDRAVRGVHANVSEMFEEEYFSNLMEYIVGRATFFQAPKTFTRMHDQNYRKSDGIYYDKPNYRSGIRQGSYIHIGGYHDLEHTVLHEWGHEFMYRFCEAGISMHPYSSFDPNKRYDDVMREVFAILFERLAGKDEYDEDPHMTANKLVTKVLRQKSRLEDAEVRHPLRFSDVLMYALRFNDHEDFAQELSQLRKINNPAQILRLIRNSGQRR